MSSDEVVTNVATMGEGLMGIYRTENDFRHELNICEQLVVCIQYIIIINIYYTTT